MKLVIPFLLSLAICICDSCKYDNVGPVKASSELLVGHWNDYENGTEQTGFTAGITTSLTIAYESGIAFSSDGTFRTRYYYNGTWAESDSAIGTYELSDKTISLLFSPGTADEYKFVVQLVKLDERHLWFKHSLFVETEYHLERVAK